MDFVVLFVCALPFVALNTTFVVDSVPQLKIVCLSVFGVGFGPNLYGVIVSPNL